MKNFLKKILQNIFLQIISLLFVFGLIAFAAITFPSTTPSGETAGGKFMTYFNNLKSGSDCPEGEAMVGFNSNFTKKCRSVSNTSTSVITTSGCSTPDIVLSNGQAWASCNSNYGNGYCRDSLVLMDATQSCNWGKFYKSSQLSQSCPTGYHVPTTTEWKSAYINKGNSMSALMNTFGITYDNNLSGMYNDGDSNGGWVHRSKDAMTSHLQHFWHSNGTKTAFWRPESSGKDISQSVIRPEGLFMGNVRCIKDNPSANK